jgi:hypothetical protein
MFKLAGLNRHFAGFSTSQKCTGAAVKALTAESRRAMSSKVDDHPVFTYKVKGQEGTIPKLGLGTACMDGEECINAVSNALNNGYKMIDTAFLYANQEAIGKGIKKSGVPREDVFLTTKIAFFPELATSENVFQYQPNIQKGFEAESIDMCLEKLGVDYVDCLLVHSPLASVAEYNAGAMPHFFEYANHMNLDHIAIKPAKLPGVEPYGGESLRKLLIDAKMDLQVKSGIDFEAHRE